MSCIPSKGNPVNLAALATASAAFAFFIIFFKSASFDDIGPYPNLYLHGPKSALGIGSLHPCNPKSFAMVFSVCLSMFSILKPPSSPKYPNILSKPPRAPLIPSPTLPMIPFVIAPTT